MNNIIVFRLRSTEAVTFFKKWSRWLLPICLSGILGLCTYQLVLMSMTAQLRQIDLKFGTSFVDQAKLSTIGHLLWDTGEELPGVSDSLRDIENIANKLGISEDIIMSEVEKLKQTYSIDDMWMFPNQITEWADEIISMSEEMGMLR